MMWTTTVYVYLLPQLRSLRHYGRKANAKFSFSSFFCKQKKNANVFFTYACIMLRSNMRKENAKLETPSR